jgi:hypothetical protein
VQLGDADDSISWRFTADGRYSAQSAYNVQFLGAVKDGQWNIVWRAKVENKCKFFMWLLLQAKLPTADRVIKYNGQANPTCTLCRIHAEKHLHMVAKCSYVKEVWQRVATLSSIQAPPTAARNIGTWWRSTLRQGSADMTNHTQVLIYTIWNIWKERCRRVFQNVAISADQLAATIRQDILTYRHAYTIVE